MYQHEVNGFLVFRLIRAMIGFIRRSYKFSIGVVRKNTVYAAFFHLRRYLRRIYRSV